MSLFDRLAEKPGSPPMRKGEYEKSIAKLLKKIDSSSKKGDRARTAWLYQMASVIARKARQWKDGVKYALLAADNSEKDGKMFNAGWSYRSAAIASKLGKEYKGAVEYALRGANSFSLSKSGYAAKWCYQLAAEACEESGDHERAIDMYKKAYSIEQDEECGHEIDRLKHIVTHPTVDQYAEKGEVVEGDPVRFEVVVENHSRDMIRDIVVGDKGGKLSHEIPALKPGDVKIFSYDAQGKLGYMHSPYTIITWKSAKGKAEDMELEPASVLVRPRMQVNSYVSPDPVIKKDSELVILVKNLSSGPVYDVKLDIDFPDIIKSSLSSPDTFNKIGPGEEKGADWKIVPSVVGLQRIAHGSAVMQDERGTEFRQEIRPVVAEVLEREHPERKLFAKKEEFRQEKKRFDSSITACPISESEYVSLSKGFWNQQRGYTFRGAGPDVVLHHVEENCKDMALVSRHDLGREKMLLYSFRLEGAHCLLTVVIKQEEGFIHLILKLSSESRDALVPTLQRVSDIIRYTIKTETEASEVEKVEIKKVINIVDSIVQRSQIASGGAEGEVKDKKTSIKDSVVQRTGT